MRKITKKKADGQIKSKKSLKKMKILCKKRFLLLNDANDANDEMMK